MSSMRGISAWGGAARPSAAPRTARGGTARARRFAVARLALVLAAGVTACDLGLDVGALQGGCPDCADAAIDGRDGSSSIQEAAASDDSADAGPDADAGAERCPSMRGPPMVLAGGLCVDRTEVSNAQYEGFLDAGAPPPTPPCAADAAYVPSGAWPVPAAARDQPVRSVSWCAARAFCAWAGKRLCGVRNGSGSGGPLDVALLGRPDFDEWTAACSQGGTVAYPYGDTFSGTACNGNDFGVQRPVPAGSLDGCGPDGGARDLSGNVWEWIDACEADAVYCYARGGAFNSPAPELACSSRLRVARDAGLDTVGIRCCAR